MGRRPRISEIPRQQRGRFTLPEAIYYSVKAGSRKSYLSALHTHEARGYALTLGDLQQHLLCWDDLGDKTVLINAFDWLLRANGRPRMTLEEKDRFRACARAVNGVNGASKQRGAIDLVKLDQLQAHVRVFGMEYARDDMLNIELCWGTGLRRCDMAVLRREHFVRVGDRWIVEMEERHSPTRGDRVVPLIRVTQVHDRVLPLLNRLLPELQGDDRVTRRWNPGRISRYIHDVAQLHGWDNRLQWDGPHCLRHGVITSLVESGGIEAARAVSGHAANSSCVERRYGVPNEDRAAKATKMEAQREDGATRAARIRRRKRQREDEEAQRHRIATKKKSKKAKK
jgi:hypothetical protein